MEYIVDIPDKNMTNRKRLVRCKDCKHRPKEPDWKTFESGWDLEFPDDSKCPCQILGDSWYSWYPDDDWFCGYGEQKDGEQDDC